MSLFVRPRVNADRQKYPRGMWQANAKSTYAKRTLYSTSKNSPLFLASSFGETDRWKWNELENYIQVRIREARAQAKSLIHVSGIDISQQHLEEKRNSFGEYWPKSLTHLDIASHLCLSRHTFTPPPPPPPISGPLPCWRPAGWVIGRHVLCLDGRSFFEAGFS